MKNKCYLWVLMILLTACQDKPQETRSDADVQAEDQVEIDSHIKSQNAELNIPETVTKSNSVNTYPSELIQFINVRQGGCPKNHQQKIEDLVQMVDLIGDDRPEYILEPDSIHCEKIASMRGNGGREIAVFATLKDGSTQQVFDHAMFDFEIKATNSKPELWLDVGGGYCGQDMSQISRSEAIVCKRLVMWDEKAQQLKLGKMVVADQVGEEDQVVERDLSAEGSI